MVKLNTVIIGGSTIGFLIVVIFLVLSKISWVNEKHAIAQANAKWSVEKTKVLDVSIIGKNDSSSFLVLPQNNKLLKMTKTIFWSETYSRLVGNEWPKIDSIIWIASSEFIRGDCNCNMIVFTDQPTMENHLKEHPEFQLVSE